jgi:O-antigen/teichoic acid export membrane protein
MLFAALGIPIYGIREISKTTNSFKIRSKVFSEIISIHFITSIFCILIYLFIITFFDRFHQNSTIYLFGAFYIFINTFSIEWFFNGLSEFKYIAIRSVLIRFFFLIGLFLLVKKSSDVFWYFSLNVMVLFINNLVNIYYLRKKVRYTLQNLNLKIHLKPLLIIFLSTLAISLYILIDTLILGFLKADNYVGYYTVASKLNKVPLTFLIALGGVLIPQLSKAADEKDMVNFQKLIHKSFDFVIMLGVPLTLVLFLFSKELILLFSGKEFLPAINSMRVMTSVSLLIGLSNIFGLQILTPLGNDKKFLIAVTFGTITSLLLNFILIPIFADLGAAITNLFSEIMVTLITGYFASKIIDISSSLKALTLQIIYYIPVLILGICLNQFIDSSFINIIVILLFTLLTFIVINFKILKTPLALEALQYAYQKLGYGKI